MNLHNVAFLALVTGFACGCTSTPISPGVDELGCGPVPISGVVTQKNKFTLAKLLVGGKAVEGLNIESTPELHTWMSEAARDLATIQYLRCVAVKSGEAGADNAELQNCIESRRLLFALKPKPEEFARFVRDNPCATRQTESEKVLRIAGQLSDEFHRAIKLRPSPLKEEDFRRVTELMSQLSLLEPRNGHVYYFRGEMKRWLGRKDEAQQDFYLYLESERAQPAHVREGDVSIKVCSQNSAGYCRQRSGWICHVIANDFYEKGVSETQQEKARYYFTKALEFAKRSRGFFPEGFSQFTPTDVVERIAGARVVNFDAVQKPTTK